MRVISLGTGRISPVYYVYLVYRDLRYLGGTILAEYNYNALCGISTHATDACTLQGAERLHESGE
jgi:hypothetical protein